MINIFDIDSNSNDIVKLLMVILRMEEILRHLGWLKPYKQWNKPPINWCRISSIHRMRAGYDNKHDNAYHICGGEHF
jgi:hypothetical protein